MLNRLEEEPVVVGPCCEELGDRAGNIACEKEDVGRPNGRTSVPERHG